VTSSGSGTFNFRNAASLVRQTKAGSTSIGFFWIFVAVVISDVPDVALCVLSKGEKPFEVRNPSKSHRRATVVSSILLIPNSRGFF